MSVEAGARWWARIRKKWPTVAMNPIRQSSAHQCQQGNAVHAKGSAIVATSAPTQPV